MLFWLFVILLVIGVAFSVLGTWMYDNTRFDTDWLRMLGCVIKFFATLAVLVSLVLMIVTYLTVDADIALNQEKYKSLTYQLDNNLYDNDNDIGKKALYDEIREWNEDLAYYRALQDDPWLGIFIPDVFDQFEFIELKGGGGYGTIY